MAYSKLSIRVLQEGRATRRTVAEVYESEERKSTKTYSDHVLISNTTSLNGVYDGECKFYSHKTGVLMTKINYTKGKANGLLVQYQNTGQLYDVTLIKDNVNITNEVLNDGIDDLLNMTDADRMLISVKYGFTW